MKYHLDAFVKDWGRNVGIWIKKANANKCDGNRFSDRKSLLLHSCGNEWVTEEATAWCGTRYDKGSEAHTSTMALFKNTFKSHQSSKKEENLLVIWEVLKFRIFSVNVIIFFLHHLMSLFQFFFHMQYLNTCKYVNSPNVLSLLLCFYFVLFFKSYLFPTPVFKNLNSSYPQYFHFLMCNIPIIISVDF